MWHTGYNYCQYSSLSYAVVDIYGSGCAEDPCLVLMVIVRFWLSRSVRSHVAPSHPCLFITYMMASSHAKPEDYRKPDDYRIYVKLAQYYDPEISNF